MRAVRERYPYPTRGRRDLTASEVVRAAARRRASSRVERWDAPPEDLERIEEGGRLDLERYGGRRPAASRSCPASRCQLARYRFGTVGPSQPLRRAAARRGGARPRAGGGARRPRGPAHPPVPRRRRRADRRDRPAVLPAQGLPAPDQGGQRRPQAAGSTCASARSYAQLRERLRLYFTDGCPPLALDSDEGQRLMLANAAAMNYGFAFRIATYASLRRLAAESFGGADRPAGRRLPAQQHLRGGRRRRHRASCTGTTPAGPTRPSMMPPGTTFASTGQAVLLPGTHRTSSYLAVAGTGRRGSLHSACHGAGTVVSELVDRGLSATDPLGRQHPSLPVRRRRTRPRGALRRRRRQRRPATCSCATAWSRPVARMRPIAVLH